MRDFQQRKIINCFQKPILTSISFISSSSDSTVIINYILRLQLSITRQEQNDSSRGSVRQRTCKKLVVHYILRRKNRELTGKLTMHAPGRGLLLQHRHNQSVLHSWSCCFKSSQVYSWNAITYSGRRLNVTRALRDVKSLLEALYLLCVVNLGHRSIKISGKIDHLVLPVGSTPPIYAQRNPVCTFILTDEYHRYSGMFGYTRDLLPGTKRVSLGSSIPIDPSSLYDLSTFYHKYLYL